MRLHRLAVFSVGVTIAGLIAIGRSTPSATSAASSPAGVPPRTGLAHAGSGLNPRDHGLGVPRPSSAAANGLTFDCRPRFEPDALTALQPHTGDIADAVRVRTLASLRARGDALSTAAVLLMGQAAYSATMPGAAPAAAAATADAAPEAVASRMRDAAAVAARDALARTVISVQDPQLYALAYQACAALHSDAARTPGCAGLSAAQWARVEPGNAAPWIEMAAVASGPGAQSTIADALFHIARSQSVDHHLGLIGRQLLAAAPTDAMLASGVDAVVAEGLLVQAAWQGRQSLIEQACNAASMADSNRRQLCAESAVVLARSDALLDRRLALAIAQRAGSTLDVDAGALDVDNRGLDLSVFDATNDPTGCRRFTAMPTQWRETALYGEAEAAHRTAQRVASLHAGH